MMEADKISATPAIYVIFVGDDKGEEREIGN
jgi:hypothetical protein